MFKVNEHCQGNHGSVAERFLKRKPRSLLPVLPCSVERIINHNELVKARQEEQTKLANKKGRQSAESFVINDDVVMQNERNKRWTDMGRISGERKADDNSIQLFEITLEKGRKCIRNRRFIKHDISAASNADDVSTMNGDKPSNHNAEFTGQLKPSRESALAESSLKVKPKPLYRELTISYREDF